MTKKKAEEILGTLKDMCDLADAPTRYALVVFAETGELCYTSMLPCSGYPEVDLNTVWYAAFKELCAITKGIIKEELDGEEPTVDNFIQNLLPADADEIKKNDLFRVFDLLDEPAKANNKDLVTALSLWLSDWFGYTAVNITPIIVRNTTLEGEHGTFSRMLDSRDFLSTEHGLYDILTYRESPISVRLVLAGQHKLSVGDIVAWNGIDLYRVNRITGTAVFVCEVSAY